MLFAIGLVLTVGVMLILTLAAFANPCSGKDNCNAGNGGGIAGSGGKE